MAGQTMQQLYNEDDVIIAISLGTADKVLCLERSKRWYVDDKFDSCPLHFYKLITINAEFPSSSPQDINTWCCPCLWILHLLASLVIEIPWTPGLRTPCPIGEHLLTPCYQQHAKWFSINV